jgi:hypothetical protein
LNNHSKLLRYSFIFLLIVIAFLLGILTKTLLPSGKGITDIFSSEDKAVSENNNRIIELLAYLDIWQTNDLASWDKFLLSEEGYYDMQLSMMLASPTIAEAFIRSGSSFDLYYGPLDKIITSSLNLLSLYNSLEIPTEISSPMKNIEECIEYKLDWATQLKTFLFNATFPNFGVDKCASFGNSITIVTDYLKMSNLGKNKE